MCLLERQLQGSHWQLWPRTCMPLITARHLILWCVLSQISCMFFYQNIKRNMFLLVVSVSVRNWIWVTSYQKFMYVKFFWLKTILWFCIFFYYRWNLHIFPTWLVKKITMHLLSSIIHMLLKEQQTVQYIYKYFCIITYRYGLNEMLACLPFYL